MTFSTSKLSFDRTIATSPARLFHLMTDARSREVWGGPNDETVLTMEVEDLREGGQERHRCGPAEAPDFIIETGWYRIVEPSAACFTETLLVGGERIFTSLVTYTLTAVEAGTHLSVDVAVTGFVEGEDMSGEIEEGWTSAFGKLEALATKETETA